MYMSQTKKDELTFATMGADDVALDMDTECGYNLIFERRETVESEDDLMIVVCRRISRNFR